MTPPLAVSMGDPAGIGGELLLKAWAARESTALPPFFALADPDWLSQSAARSGIAAPVRRIGAPEDTAANFSSALPVLPVPLAAAANPGSPDPANAPATIRAIERGAELIHAGAASGLVTLPIAKHVLAASGFPHPGHTEYLGALAARFWGGAAQPVMMLAGPGLRTVPLTVHCALKDVPGRICAEDIVSAGRTVLESLRRDFAIAQPRLAVAGLNPHAGEGGMLGGEDEAGIRPAVERLRGEGHAVTGPHPADALFAPHARGGYDAALCMYHDQALIPVKALAFEETVNATLGLPFVRTSPDHGTAFDIAGTGKASPASFVAALRLAQFLAQNRANAG